MSKSKSREKQSAAKLSNNSPNIISLGDSVNFSDTKAFFSPVTTLFEFNP